MQQTVAMGWVTPQQKILEGIHGVEFRVNPSGETLGWAALRRRYVGVLTWRNASNEVTMQGIHEMGALDGRIVGALLSGTWGTYGVDERAGRAVGFQIPSTIISGVELHGKRAKDRSMTVQLRSGDRIGFEFEMVIGQQRQWKAKLDDELASEIVGAATGALNVSWIADPSRPDLLVARW